MAFFEGQNRLAAGAPPGPPGELTALPQTP